ncbi:hypothetical protein EJB05_10082, partial [Eragrostis curvula]
MASTAKNSPLPPELGSKPLLLRINGDSQESPTIMDPFDGDFCESSLQMETLLQGRLCLACLEGEWLFMLDEDTKECFMMSVSTHTQISLPPLPIPEEELYRCALSSPTPGPDCTVMFTALAPATDDDDQDETYLIYCRPGDEEWLELHDETEGNDDIECDDIIGSRGKMYVNTYMNTFVAIDASLSSSDEATIERRDIPHPSTMRWGCKDYLVESDGQAFLVQFYTHGIYNSEVIDMDIHCLDTSEYVWNKVESIGDRTIFAGNNCVVLSSASRLGIRPGCVHLLHKGCPDGIRLYTIRLDDRTMSCRLLPRSSGSMYWVVLSSSKRESGEHLIELSSKTSNETAFTLDEDLEQVVAPWATLPVDIVEGLVSRTCFLDYLNVREVCKGWSSIIKPVQYAERSPTYPGLMSICSSSTGVFKLFDPVVEKEYTVKSSSLCSDYFQMLLFAKHGWVLVMEGEKHMYVANPFTGERFDLPEIPELGNQFDGVSFSSAPSSPDCTVCCIHKYRSSGRTDHLYVMVWRVGDLHWTQEVIGDETQFRTAYSNPVFYHGKFYCLGTRGNLGVFNPDNMTWRVLDKPEPILDGDPMTGEQHCHLLEYKDDLIAIFRPHDKGPIDMYKLDKSRMVWTVVDKFDDEVIFVDNWNAAMMRTPRDACGNNRIYMPKLGGYNEAGEANERAFYDFKSRKYHPDYYRLTERMNSIWVQPNSFNWELLISNRCLNT